MSCLFAFLGKIDQAHHQNHARAALEEMVEFENAIREVTEKLDDDTLVIVTADHSHSMVFNGYAPRGQGMDLFFNFFRVPLMKKFLF